MRFIRSEEDLDWHLDALVSAHPAFAPIRETAGGVEIRWLDPGFAGLVRVISGQQISLAAGRAIYARLEAAFNPITAEAIAGASDDDLRAAGFSGPKIRTLRAVQEAVLGGALDLSALHDAPAEDAIAAMSEIKGIGPWTAEVYLLFAAGHPDIFPAADIALQESARMAFSLETRPSKQDMLAMSIGWTPWRSAAARLLWAYYRACKSGKAATPV